MTTRDESSDSFSSSVASALRALIETWRSADRVGSWSATEAFAECAAALEPLVSQVEHLAQALQVRRAEEKEAARVAQTRLTPTPDSTAGENEVTSAIRTVLRGFDEAVFVRNTDMDSRPDWGIRLLPFVAALGVLDKAHRDPLPPESDDRTKPEKPRVCIHGHRLYTVGCVSCVLLHQRQIL